MKKARPHSNSLKTPATCDGSPAARDEASATVAGSSHWGMAGFALLLVVCAGCTTIPEDSAMPWNTPQPWEGSPSIPGLSDR